MKQKHFKKNHHNFTAKIAAVMATVSLLTVTIFPVIPVKAEGTDKSMNLGVSSIASPATPANGSAAWSGDYVYFGNYYQKSKIEEGKQPVKWKVLDVTGQNGSSSENETMLLQSDQILDQVAFNENPDAKDSQVWNTCNLANWLNSSNTTIYESEKSGKYTKGGFLNNAFSETEQSAIYVSDGRAETNMNNFANPSISGRKIFCLSAVDMINAQYGFLNNPSRMTQDKAVSRLCSVSEYAKTQGEIENAKSKTGSYWSRSNYSIFSGTAAIINQEGHVAGYSVDYQNIGVVPALNIKKDDILFTSSAEENGKSQSFDKVETSDIHDWKLTLKDSQNFAKDTTVTVASSAVSNGLLSLKPGYTAPKVTVSHKALSQISNQYTDVTAALIATDADGNEKEIVYYGSIQNNTGATKSEFELPAGLNAGLYKLKIWGEDRNGAYETDYASKVPYELSVEVESETGHQHVFTDWKNTTDCTTGTTEKRVCKICGYEETRVAQNKEHEWETEPTIDKPATCTEKGSQSIHCKNCNATKDVEEIPATGHSGGHATCLERAVCKVCNQEYGERLEHEFDDSKWASDGGAHWHKCKSCSSRKDVAEHEWDEGTVIDDPLLTTKKIKVYRCKVCDMEKTVILSENGTETPKPDDGDTGTTPGGSGNSESGDTGTTPGGSGNSGSGDTGTTPGGSGNSESGDTGTTPGGSGNSGSGNTGTTGENSQTGTGKTSGNNVGSSQAGSSTTEFTSQTGNATEENGSLHDIGNKIKWNGAVYTILSLPEQGRKGTVSYNGPVKKTITKAVVGGTVEIQGQQYLVTAIGKKAFVNCKKLKSVTVKDSVVTIGEQAGYNCKALQKIVLGKGVKKIGAKAFYGCSKVTQIKITSSGLNSKTVGSKAFTKTGSKNYKKLIVQLPKKKYTAYKKLFKKKGLSAKAKFKK